MVSRGRSRVMNAMRVRRSSLGGQHISTTSSSALSNNLAELVDDDRCRRHAGLFQQVVEKGRLAAIEKLVKSVAGMPDGMSLAVIAHKAPLSLAESKLHRATLLTAS
jgi:hypothetical protein